MAVFALKEGLKHTEIAVYHRKPSVFKFFETFCGKKSILGMTGLG